MLEKKKKKVCVYHGFIQVVSISRLQNTIELRMKNFELVKLNL